ncbi:MAG: hypothetical protein ACI9N1_000237 [Flavobacteriales bacterium]|jgi:hypothetical protein
MLDLTKAPFWILKNVIKLYNNKRLHLSLDYQTHIFRAPKCRLNLNING